MIHLLNLLSAISLLVLGTYIVRTGVLRVFGSQLRKLLAGSFSRRLPAAAAGLGVTSLVQSSTATCLIVTSFIDKKLVGLSMALAVMLGADVGSSLMTVVLATFSLNLSFLSPLLILAGVVMFVASEQTTPGRIGRVLTGLGLITLALQLIVQATKPMTTSPAMSALLAALPDDVWLNMVIGAMLTVMAYSSAAIVLVVATLAASSVVSLSVAFGLILGANIGSGMLAMLATMKTSSEARRLPVGNFIFKTIGAMVTIPLLPMAHGLLQQWVPEVHHQVVFFHLVFNVLLFCTFIGLTDVVGGLVTRILPKPPAVDAAGRPRHLNPSALSTPSLAISCAAREVLYQADVVETMLTGLLPVIQENDRVRSKALRKMDGTVDQLYAAIKFYLTQISRDALTMQESRRWSEIMAFTINMEQIGDIIERVLQDVEEKKIRKSRYFSDAGMAEIAHMHERLVANLHLSMGVFLDGRANDARKLIEEKARFRDLEHEYTSSHITRLQDNTAQSIETSSLHLDLISDFKSINSHICSIAYPTLESTGVSSMTAARSVDPDDASGPISGGQDSGGQDDRSEAFFGVDLPLNDLEPQVGLDGEPPYILDGAVASSGGRADPSFDKPVAPAAGSALQKLARLAGRPDAPEGNADSPFASSRETAIGAPQRH